MPAVADTLRSYVPLATTHKRGEGPHHTQLHRGGTVTYGGASLGMSSVMENLTAPEAIGQVMPTSQMLMVFLSSVMPRIDTSKFSVPDVTCSAVEAMYQAW